MSARCPMWHSCAVCRPGRFPQGGITPVFVVFRDPQLEIIQSLEAVIEQMARDYAMLKAAHEQQRVDYACFVDLTLGMAKRGADMTDKELTPQGICDRLNAYDEGRGYRGTNDWYIADVDYEVLSRKFYLLPASDRQYEGCSIFLDDARALIAGWKAVEELVAAKAKADRYDWLTCNNSEDLWQLEREVKNLEAQLADQQPGASPSPIDPYSATAGFQKLVAERSQAVGTGVDLETIEAREKAATLGPWEWQDWDEDDGPDRYTLVAPPETRSDFPNGFPDLGNQILTDEDRDSLESDRDFIAHARTDIPALIAEVRRLQSKHITQGLRHAKEMTEMEAELAALRAGAGPGTWAWALENLQNGVTVTRKDEYLGNPIRLYRHTFWMLLQEGTWTVFKMDYPDIMATDWQLAEDPIGEE